MKTIRFILILVVVFVQCLTVEAQNTGTIKISGQVVDAAGTPIIGASVSAKQSLSGTVTNVVGSFELQVDRSEMIVISYLGYHDAVVEAVNADGTRIVLHENSEKIDEVVVIGYGVRKKENLTGSITSIGGDKELQTTTNVSLAQNLQGKVAGLQIRQENGEPGDFGTTINVRGFGAPLYVIDGIPQTDGSTYFQRLNPNDIENISVIKDATGAVYGRRGANGVVIVTTKLGKSEKPLLNFDMTFGLQSPTDMPEMCDRSQWAQLYNEAQLFAGAPAYTREELATEMNGATTDWYGSTMRDSSTQMKYNISASGAWAGGKNRYYVGLGYIKDNGILRTGDLNYDKYSVRSNISAKLARNLRFDLNLSGLYDTKNSPAQGYYTAFYASRTALPGSPAYANNDTAYLANQNYLNPLAIADANVSGYSLTNTRSVNGTVGLTYDFPMVKGLSLKASADYNNNLVMNKTLSKAYKLYTYTEGVESPYKAITKGSPSTISNSYNNSDLVTLQAQLSYKREFNELHSVEATVVYEQTEYHSRYSRLAREYSFYTGDQIDLASLNNQTNGGMENDVTNMSYIGRLSYGYADRYLIDIAFRYDGSCLYSPAMRWGLFPVASVAWRVSEEPFMKNQELVSNLKLRGSYGLVGEDNGMPFQYIQGFSLTGGGGYEFENGVWTDGASSPALVNERLTWFSSSITDVGIDLSLFGNSLSMTFDLYRRERSGLLSTRLLSLPNTFGATLPQENLNGDRTQGFDFTIAYNNRIGDFRYSVSGNLNFARTMNRYVEEGTFTSSTAKWRGGLTNRWSDVYWGYVLDGQFQTEEEIASAPIQSTITGNSKILPGDYKYKDMNGDGVVDGNDMVPLFYGGYPKLFYGLTFAGKWKGFDFSMLLQGSGKYTVRFKEVYAEVLAFNLNTPAYFFDRWHREDPYDENSTWVEGKWPATRFITDAGSMYNESEIWRRDASYVRLKNISVGYTISSRLLDDAGIQTVRLYFNANNILTICDPFVKPFDPEKAEGANSLGFNYPLMKSFNFGINVVF